MIIIDRSAKLPAKVRRSAIEDLLTTCRVKTDRRVVYLTRTNETHVVNGLSEYSYMVYSASGKYLDCFYAKDIFMATRQVERSLG